MKVRIRDWRGSQVVSLEAALTPFEHLDNEGIAESARYQARRNAEVLGRLLAFLVEQHGSQMDLATAKEIAGVHGDMEIADD